jgi:hypothetical protein
MGMRAPRPGGLSRRNWSLAIRRQPTYFGPQVRGQHRFLSQPTPSYLGSDVAVRLEFLLKGTVGGVAVTTHVVWACEHWYCLVLAPLILDLIYLNTLGMESGLYPGVPPPSSFHVA